MTLNIQLQLPSEYVNELRRRAAEHGENLDVYISHIVAEEVQVELSATRRNESKARDFGE